MQISLSKLTKVTSLKTILKIAPGKDSLCFDFFEKRFFGDHKKMPKITSFFVKLWNSVLECWFYYCLLEQVLFRLILAIPEHSFCLCVSSFFFEFDFLEIRTQFMVSVMTHYALIFSFILCFLLIFYSENEFGSLKWRKTLKWQPTHEMRNASFSSISDHV